MVCLDYLGSNTARVSLLPVVFGSSLGSLDAGSGEFYTSAEALSISQEAFLLSFL
jgi:hypothetical protein